MNDSDANIVLTLPIHTAVTVTLPSPADAKTYLKRFSITLPLDMAGEQWDHLHDYRRVQAEVAVAGVVFARLIAIQNHLLQLLQPNSAVTTQWFEIGASGAVKIKGDWFQSVIQGEEPLPWAGDVVHLQPKGFTQLEILAINLHSSATLWARWRVAIRQPAIQLAFISLLLQACPQVSMPPFPQHAVSVHSQCQAPEPWLPQAEELPPAANELRDQVIKELQSPDQHTAATTLQCGLKILNYYHDNIDGLIYDRTNAAIARYAKARGLVEGNADWKAGAFQSHFARDVARALHRRGNN